MIFRIPKGKHYSRPWHFGIYWRKTSFAWVVKFDESCMYDLGDDDQFDTNKLCGVGYLPHHHKESARFGWRYDTKLQQVELLAYCYVGGKRKIESVCFCDIGKEYHIILNVTSICYHLHAYERYSTTCLGMVTVGHDHNKKLGYRLGLYFGGNQVAPHEIKVAIKRG
jgi:hypothetical protein